MRKALLIACLSITFTYAKSRPITVKANINDMQYLHVYYVDQFYDFKNSVTNDEDEHGEFTLNLDLQVYPAIITCELFSQHISFLAFEGKTYRFRKNAEKGLYVEESGIDRSAIYTFLEQQTGTFRSTTYGFGEPTSLDKYAKNSYSRKIKRDSILSKSNLSLPETAFYKEYILYEYVNDLLQPYLRAESGYNYNLVPNTYKNNLTSLLSLFKNNYQPNNDKYRLAAKNFCSFLARISTGESGSFKQIYESAENQFSGKARELTQFYILKDNIKKGIPEYERYLKSYLVNNQKTVYNSYLDSVYAFYTKPIPESVLAEKLTAYHGTETTFRELLENLKGKIVYIDFWASWCMPCLAEFPKSEKLINSLKSKDVVFIFLSLDKEQVKWISSTSKFGFLNSENSFLINQSFESEIAKKYKISAIPRYMLIDKNGLAIDIDAVRPGNTLILSTIYQHLNN